jgi:tetratricopeptide (TPR) repeat protein
MRQCRCGADLSLLHQLDSVADAWFNRALEAIAEGALGRALEWLSAACAARPTDAAAHRARARVWVRLGNLADAQAALTQAAELEPDHPDTIALRAALQAPPSAPQARRASKRAPRGRRTAAAKPAKKSTRKKSHRG